VATATARFDRVAEGGLVELLRKSPGRLWLERTARLISNTRGMNHLR
jgi:hypothetical protein